jgi:hypothetical protein
MFHEDIVIIKNPIDEKRFNKVNVKNDNYILFVDLVQLTTLDKML